MNKKLKSILIGFGLISWIIPTTSQAFPFIFRQKKKVTPPVVVPQKNVDSESFLSLFKPPENSMPSYTVGGAVRSNSCFQSLEQTKKMKALAPDSLQSITTKSHPEFFAYIPPMDEEKSAMLVVRDRDEDYYYSHNMMVPAEGGIVKIDLPQNAPELEVGKEYDWFLQVNCTATPKIDDPILEAKVKRVSVADNSTLTSNEELVAFYAQNKVWYDSLASAYDLMESDQNGLYWQELISSIGLDEFASEPITSFEP